MKCTALLPLLLLLLPGDETLVARAKGIEYTRAQYGEWLVQRLGIQFLDDYVFADLVQRVAAERGLLPTQAELEAAFEEEFQRATDHGKTGDLDSFTKDLAQAGYSLETWKARRILELRSDLSHARLARAGRVITDERLQSRYRDLFGDLGERTSVEVYFFSAYRDLDPADQNPDIPALKTAARARAEEARAQLLAGADRAAVMAGTDPVASDFVKDGIITGYRRQMLGRDIEKAVSSLDEPGDTSLVVDAFDGSYVLRLIAREPVRFEDVREELVAAVRAEDVDGSELAAVRNEVMESYAVERVLR
jgi:hypothetical protein